MSPAVRCACVSLSFLRLGAPLTPFIGEGTCGEWDKGGGGGDLKCGLGGGSAGCGAHVTTFDSVSLWRCETHSSQAGCTADASAPTLTARTGPF
jgi:hypothetical protein